MQSILENTIPFGQFEDQVQPTNIHFFIFEGHCPTVHTKRSGEKVCDCEPCTGCLRCRGGQ